MSLFRSVGRLIDPSESTRGPRRSSATSGSGAASSSSSSTPPLPPPPKPNIEDYKCCVCFSLLYEPATFPCGHSVCSIPCLRTLSLKDCPICRASLPFPTVYGVDVRLRDLLKLAFVSEYSIREKEEQSTRDEDSKVEQIILDYILGSSSGSRISEEDSSLIVSTATQQIVSDRLIQSIEKHLSAPPASSSAPPLSTASKIRCVKVLKSISMGHVVNLNKLLSRNFPVTLAHFFRSEATNSSPYSQEHDTLLASVTELLGPMTEAAPQYLSPCINDAHLLDSLMSILGSCTASPPPPPSPGSNPTQPYPLTLPHIFRILFIIATVGNGAFLRRLLQSNYIQRFCQILNSAAIPAMVKDSSLLVLSKVVQDQSLQSLIAQQIPNLFDSIVSYLLELKSSISSLEPRSSANMSTPTLLSLTLCTLLANHGDKYFIAHIPRLMDIISTPPVPEVTVRPLTLHYYAVVFRILTSAMVCKSALPISDSHSIASQIMSQYETRAQNLYLVLSSPLRDRVFAWQFVTALLSSKKKGVDSYGVINLDRFLNEKIIPAYAENVERITQPVDIQTYLGMMDALITVKSHRKALFDLGIVDMLYQKITMTSIARDMDPQQTHNQNSVAMLSFLNMTSFLHLVPVSDLPKLRVALRRFVNCFILTSPLPSFLTQESSWDLNQEMMNKIAEDKVTDGELVGVLAAGNIPCRLIVGLLHTFTAAEQGIILKKISGNLVLDRFRDDAKEADVIRCILEVFKTTENEETRKWARLDLQHYAMRPAYAQDVLEMTDAAFMEELFSSRTEFPIPQDMQKCLQDGKCTLLTTGKKHTQRQYWYECAADCSIVDGTGVCEGCAEKCHRELGHIIAKVPFFSFFFCDCSDAHPLQCNSLTRAELSEIAARPQSSQ